MMNDLDRHFASIQKSQAKDCCKQYDNLFEAPMHGKLFVLKCRVCGCRHFRVVPESAPTKVEASS